MSDAGIFRSSRTSENSYADIDELLKRNVNCFGDDFPPTVLEIDFCGLWDWEIYPALLNLMPAFAGVLPACRCKMWQCVWLSKLSLPDCERCFSDLIFFCGTQSRIEPEKFEIVSRDITHWCCDVDRCRMISMPCNQSCEDWLHSLCCRKKDVCLLDYGELNC